MKPTCSSDISPSSLGAQISVMSLVHDILWASEAAFGIGGLVGAGAVLARPRERPRGSAPDLSPLVK